MITIKSLCKSTITLIGILLLINIALGFIKLVFPSMNNKDRIYDISSKIKEKMFEVAPSLYENYEKDEVTFTFKNSSYQKRLQGGDSEELEKGIYYFNIANTPNKLIVDWSINDSNVLLINKIIRREDNKKEIIYEKLITS